MSSERERVCAATNAQHPLCTRDATPKGGAKDRAQPGNGDPEQKEEDENEKLRPSAAAAALTPSWLGAFTVSAYDEVVAVPFEVAALVDGEEAAATAGGGRARRGGEDGGGSDDSVVQRRALGEGGGKAGLPARTGEGWLDRRSKDRRRRRALGGLTRGVAGLDGRDQEGGVAGEEEDGEEEDEEEDEGRKLDTDDDGCEVTVCAAAARILLGREGRGGGDDEPPQGGDGDGRQSVCRSVVVKRKGAAVSGVLELPDRPQVTRALNLACRSFWLF